MKLKIMIDIKIVGNKLKKIELTKLLRHTKIDEH